jgi:hypothetical protein
MFTSSFSGLLTEGLLFIAGANGVSQVKAGDLYLDSAGDDAAK